MGKIRKISEEVEFNAEERFFLDRTSIEKLKKNALQSKTKKYRTCIHFSESDKVHEMVIVHAHNTYVRPHKHLTRLESLQVIEGRAAVIIFNDEGEVSKIASLGDIQSGLPFFYCFRNPVFHALVVESEFLVFKETTSGPFSKADTIYPIWAPIGPSLNERGPDGEAVKLYMEQMRLRIKKEQEIGRTT
jgi:cupin fold WbuC family metalloprotein